MVFCSVTKATSFRDLPDFPALPLDRSEFESVCFHHWASSFISRTQYIPLSRCLSSPLTGRPLLHCPCKISSTHSQSVTSTNAVTIRGSRAVARDYKDPGLAHLFCWFLLKPFSRSPVASFPAIRSVPLTPSGFSAFGFLYHPLQISLFLIV
jgi:hypothetical protein